MGFSDRGETPLTKNSINIKKTIYMKQIKDSYKATVCGIGYIGGDKYAISIKHKHTKIYQLWINLLNRCYNPKYHLTHSAYKDCTVCDEWLNFQNFGEWFDKNYNLEVMQDWQLDKDILIYGNKIYGPNTCCFVPKEINIAIRNNSKTQNKYSKGICFRNNKFVVCVNVGKGKKYCGSFKILSEAILCYNHSKQQYISSLLYTYKDVLSKHVYNRLLHYNFYN